MNKDYTLQWPDDFDDYSWELESKGWFSGLVIILSGRTFRPTFYDPVRLSQDIATEISQAGLFAETFLIVMHKVTRETIEHAVADLVSRGGLARFL